MNTRTKERRRYHAALEIYKALLANQRGINLGYEEVDEAICLADKFLARLEAQIR